MTTLRQKHKAEYQAWQHMKRRCYNRNCEDFPAYGGKGVVVCAEWLCDFTRFLSDMGPRPTPSHSIDRRDGSLGYSKGNCRWATKFEQAQNRPEFVILLTFGGETKTIAEWAREKSIFPQTVYRRYANGWSVERILGQPPSNEIRKDNRLLTFNGKTQTVARWTREIGAGRNLIKDRLARGWSVAQAISTPRDERRLKKAA